MAERRCHAPRDGTGRGRNVAQLSSKEIAQTLLSIVRRFCDTAAFAEPHPFFGAMSRQEWLRWGYLHADHHLRQFGR